MSSKKTSFIESHFEKMLAVLAGLLFVSITFWQLFILTVGVKVGSETINLQDLNEKIVEKQKDLEDNLSLDKPSPLELPEPKIVSNIEIYRRNQTESIAPKTLLPANQPSFGKLLAGESLSANQWFYVPKFPAGSMRGVVVTNDAFDKGEIVGETLEAIRKESPAFAARYLDSDSVDVSWATPWAVIDLATLRRELDRNEQSAIPPRDALPRPWFNDSLYILDVVFERQEKNPDNSWSKPVIVPTVPGQDSWRLTVQSNEANATARDTVYLNLSNDQMQIDVLQPSPLPMLKQNFQPPGETLTQQVDPAEAERYLAEERMKQSKNNLQKLLDALKKAGGALSPPPPPKGTGGGTGDNDSGGGKGGGGKGGGGGFGGGAGGSMKKNDPQGSTADDQMSKDKRISLTKRVAQAEKSLQKIQEAFAKKYPVKKVNGSDIKEQKTPFKEMQSVLAWTHDFDVREGSTYRYSTTVKIYNPFFTRKILLVPEQQPLSSGLAVSSTTSEWGEEVTIPSATSFFLTRGSARDGIGGRRISIDLFRYSSGVLRSTSEDLKLGDPVGSVVGAKDAAIDFSTLWYVADIFDDAGSDVTGGILAVFQRRTNTGEIAQEIRSLSDKDSEIYKEFKKQLPETQPKKVDPKTPKA